MLTGGLNCRGVPPWAPRWRCIDGKGMITRVDTPKLSGGC